MRRTHTHTQRERERDVVAGLSNCGNMTLCGHTSVKASFRCGWLHYRCNNCLTLLGILASQESTAKSEREGGENTVVEAGA